MLSLLMLEQIAFHHTEIIISVLLGDKKVPYKSDTVSQFYNKHE